MEPLSTERGLGLRQCRFEHLSITNSGLASGAGDLVGVDVEGFSECEKRSGLHRDLFGKLPEGFCVVEISSGVLIVIRSHSITGLSMMRAALLPCVVRCLTIGSPRFQRITNIVHVVSHKGIGIKRSTGAPRYGPSHIQHRQRGAFQRPHGRGSRLPATRPLAAGLVKATYQSRVSQLTMAPEMFLEGGRSRPTRPSPAPKRNVAMIKILLLARPGSGCRSGGELFALRGCHSFFVVEHSLDFVDERVDHVGLGDAAQLLAFAVDHPDPAAAG